MILYKYTSEVGLKRFLNGLKLRFTPPLAFNDPFEIRPTFRDHSTRKAKSRRLSLFSLDADWMWGSPRRSLNLGIGVNVGILCLSEDPCQPLMWAHYADCHKGAVIGFDSDHPFFGTTLPPDRLQFLKPVKYSRTRSVLSLDFFRKYQTVEVARSGWIELLKEQHPLFYTKSPEWEYEKEWRLVRQLLAVPDTPEEWSRRILVAEEPAWISPDQLTPMPVDQLISVPPKAIKSITLGAVSRMQGPGDSDGFEEETVKILESNTELSHVELWKVRLHSRNFSVVRFNLDSLRDVKRNVIPMELTMRRTGTMGRPPRKP